MAKVIEVAEEDYARLARVNETLAKIARNPKAARLLEQAHKEVDPSVTTPLSDKEKEANAPLEALRKELDDIKKQAAEDKAKADQERAQASIQARWSKGRTKLLDAGWQPEGLEKLEKMMEEKGILDHEDAAKIFEADHPPQPPAMPGGTGAWNFLDMPDDTKDKHDEGLKKLIANKGENDLVADRMAREALQEFRQQVAQGARR